MKNNLDIITALSTNSAPPGTSWAAAATLPAGSRDALDQALGTRCSGWHPSASSPCTAPASPPLYHRDARRRHGARGAGEVGHGGGRQAETPDAPRSRHPCMSASRHASWCIPTPPRQRPGLRARRARGGFKWFLTPLARLYRPATRSACASWSSRPTVPITRDVSRAWSTEPRRLRPKRTRLRIRETYAHPMGRLRRPTAQRAWIPRLRRRARHRRTPSARRRCRYCRPPLEPMPRWCWRGRRSTARQASRPTTSFMSNPISTRGRHRGGSGAFAARRGYPARVLALPEGMLACGATAAVAERAAEFAADAARIRQLARAFGGVQYLSDAARRFLENWEVESYRARQTG